MKVAIVGFGSEGLSAYNYFAAQNADITIFDSKSSPNQQVPAGAKFVTGKGYMDNLMGYDKVVRFPAISPESIKTDGEVTSVIIEFFKACPAPIIGVTGSKGKGTTSSLIALMLQNSGIKTHLAGNIGIPALNILPDVKKDDVVVLELSSFQLWDLKQSPQTAVVLMIEPEHLDIHKDIDDYLNAKSNISKWQSSKDKTIYLEGNEYSQKVALHGEGQKVPYTKPPGAYVEDNYFVMDGVKVCSVDSLKLRGGHNIDNACAAITAAWQFTKDTQAITKALGEFEGLQHRLKFVRDVDGVSYFDDSFATTPTSAVAALHAFSEPKIIILGGSDKGVEFDDVAKAVAESNMRGVILIGQMRGKLQKEIIQTACDVEIRLVDENGTMQQIVETAAEMSEPGDVVILSPACASFDMFKDYKDRGEQFIKSVKSL